MQHCPSWRPPDYTPALLDRIVATAHATAADKEPRFPIGKCSNLAPTHTASSTLYKLLSKVSPKLAHHRHQFDLSFLASRNASCFFMTLREPTARYLSAWAFELRAHSPGHEIHLINIKKRKTASSPQLFLGALRDTSHEHHATAVALFNGSMGRNKNWTSGWERSGSDAFLSGNTALIPQVDYLLGLDHMDMDGAVRRDQPTPRSKVDLHILCSDRLDKDWNIILRRYLEPKLDFFRMVANASNVTRVERTAAKARVKMIEHVLDGDSTPDHINSTPDLQFRLPDSWRSLDAEDAAYVRDCLFPEDTWLYARLCASHGTSSQSQPAVKL